MKRIRVTVTQEDIDTQDGAFCPVERAVRRIGYPNAQVGITVWDPYHGLSGSRELPLSLATTQFIRRFDLGHPVQPATFILRVPA